ncbi:MAG: succinate dehydrogenase/fumarate reductase iron-sulfur subunit [Candidatus Micrarchaeales archaeon]
MADEFTRKTTFIINSFDRNSKSFKTREYVTEVGNLTTVLDALIHIKETLDPAISFRYSCRMGICGSCAMVIDGKPSLACETNVFKQNKEQVVVEPIRAQPLLKSLVTDFDDFFQKHKEVFPWIIRSNNAERFEDRKEFHQTEEQRDYFLPFAECIKCGLCLDACPVVNTNKNFIGPQALGQAYRYIADSKDQGKAKRLDYLDTLDGAWGCEFSGSCSKVCPKSVDPALAIQLLKSEIAKHKIKKMI